VLYIEKNKNIKAKLKNAAACIYLVSLSLFTKLKFIIVTTGYILKYTFYLFIFRVDYYNYKNAINIIKTAYNMNFSKEFANYDISRDEMIEYLKKPVKNE
jgi:hypothetical protein